MAVKKENNSKTNKAGKEKNTRKGKAADKATPNPAPTQSRFKRDPNFKPN